MTFTSTTANAGRRHVKGVGLVFMATIAWSFSGLYTRLLTTDVFTAIAWRAFFGGSFLLVQFVAQNRRRTFAALAISWPGVGMVACIAACSACTVGAFYYTSIANAAVIYATAPFMAAGLSLLFLGEPLRLRTVFACVASLFGVVIIVSNAVGSDGILGDLLALGMTLTFAFIIVIPRIFPEVNVAATSIIGAGVTLVCFAPFGEAAAMPLQDWTVLAAFGFTNYTIALVLFLAGSRHLAAAQAALIGTLDVVLAPWWVWVAFKERPAAATVIGGGIILAGVLGHTFLEWRDERQASVGVSHA